MLGIIKHLITTRLDVVMVKPWLLEKVPWLGPESLKTDLERRDLAWFKFRFLDLGFILINHLEVKVKCFLQIEAGWEAFVFLHKVCQGKVPVGCVPLREEYWVVKPNIIIAPRHFVKVIHDLGWIMQILSRIKWKMHTRSNFEDTGRPGLSLARRSPADMMAPLLSSGLCGLLLKFWY